jgi:hypothetical protein
MTLAPYDLAHQIREWGGMSDFIILLTLFPALLGLDAP